MATTAMVCSAVTEVVTMELQLQAVPRADKTCLAAALLGRWGPQIWQFKAGVRKRALEMFFQASALPSATVPGLPGILPCAGASPEAAKEC